MRIPLWEPRNPAERSQYLGGAKNPRTDTLKRGRRVSLYLCHPSPKAAQLSAKRPPSAHSLSQGSESKWAPNCPSLQGHCPGGPLLSHPTQNRGNQHGRLGFWCWYLDLNTGCRSYWLACGHQEVWKRRSKRVDCLQSELSCFQLKIDCCNYNMCYVSLILITKKKPVADTQKIKRKESRQLTKEDSKRENKGQSNYRAVWKNLIKWKQQVLTYQ